MHEVQDSVLSLAFIQQIPKSICDKIDNYLEITSNKDDKGKNGKRNGGGNGNNHDSNQKNQDVLYNSDKSNTQWCLQVGENFLNVFYAMQKACPKTADGKLICMKFLV
jgi:hypothetical protein